MNEMTLKNFQAQFQTFDDPPEASESARRLAALRAELTQRGLDGFIVPHADRHQNEYLPPSEERLAWLTGFSGSAGVALVLADRALVFVDGRYLLQAREQVDASTFVIEHLIERPPETWIEETPAAGTKLGDDPWLHTIAGAERLAKAAEAAGAKLVPVDSNPVDAVWSDRPAPPLGPVVLRDLRFAGEDASAKLARVA